MLGIIAKKLGMSRIIREDGAIVPVTILQVSDGEILQIRDLQKDGYKAIKIGAFPRKKDYKNEGKKFLVIKEIRIEDKEEITKKKGEKITLQDFSEIKDVKITGYSKGRGFSGVIKRHNFSRGPETHGSHHHREPGSVGMCAKPGRILKGKKMPGQYGNTKVTCCSEIVDIDTEKNVIAIKGGIPGAINSFVFIRNK